MGVEVVSVHFPKAGGSSLRNSFLAAYGEDGVCFDYVDDPADPCSPYNLDPVGCLRRARATRFAPGVRVIHGHFHPSKYQHIGNAKRITFLRHPIDNLISIYYFWKNCVEHSHCLFDYFRDHDLNLMDMAHFPTHRYLLSRTFFGGVDMETFDFVGTMANYEEDCRSLSRLLSIPLDAFKANVNAHAGYRGERERITGDRALMKKLSSLLCDDIEFYESAVAKHSRRCLV